MLQTVVFILLTLSRNYCDGLLPCCLIKCTQISIFINDRRIMHNNKLFAIRLIMSLLRLVKRRTVSPLRPHDTGANCFVYISQSGIPNDPLDHLGCQIVGRVEDSQT